jgi:hypothetical protein
MEDLTYELTRKNLTLEKATEILCCLEYMAGFLAYEVVMDLRYTDVLCNAPDINTWANPTGPGCRRGAARILGQGLDGPPAPLNTRQTLQVMRGLLGQAPQRFEAFFESIGKYTGIHVPKWEMHQVEFWLCEFDKYERVRLWQGRPRRKFVPSD